MNQAERLMDGIWSLVFPENLNESDRRASYRCPECKQPAVLCLSKLGYENYFRSDVHRDGCSIAKKGIVFKERDGTVIDLNAVLAHHDKPGSDIPPTITPPILPPPTGGGDDCFDNFDNATKHIIIKHSTCSSIYRALMQRRLNELILDGSDLRVKDFLIDERTIDFYRTTRINGQKMMVCKRFNISALNPPLTKSSKYIILRDAFSVDDKKAIYVRIRMELLDYDQKMRDKLFGNEKKGIEKDTHKYLVIIGDFNKKDDGPYNVYEVSPLSSKRICLTNKIGEY